MQQGHSDVYAFNSCEEWAILSAHTLETCTLEARIVLDLQLAGCCTTYEVYYITHTHFIQRVGVYLKLPVPTSH